MQTMKTWLLEIMKKLHELTYSSALENGKRMASVLSIMLCFHYLIPKYVQMESFNDDEIAMMVSMLEVFPHKKRRECLEYDYVNKMIQPKEKKQIADTILAFCNQLHHKTRFAKIQWLYAIPLLHFLQEVCQPFDNLELDPNEMKWGDASLGLYNLQQNTYTGDFR